MMGNYSNLEQFLGCYFHQDWVDFAASFSEAVSLYLNESPFDDIQKTLMELRDLLSKDDPELVKAVESMCAYYPPGDGLTYREWLLRVADQLNAYVADMPVKQ